MTEDKEEDDSEPPLKRTKSQAAKLKVGIPELTCCARKAP